MYLLDTCTLLWLVADQSKLSRSALECIDSNDAALFVSSISAFEIGVKHRKGRLRLPMSPDAWFAGVVEFHDLREIRVDGPIAAHSTTLPTLHADPCDRMLVATAQRYRLKILTPDPLIGRYPGVETVW